MEAYIWAVGMLSGGVALLLLLGTNRLCGYPLGLKRCLLGALSEAVYGGLCMVRELYFLGNGFWRLVFLCLSAMAAFGMERKALRRGVVFVLLSLILAGVVSPKQGIVTTLVGALGILAVCMLSRRSGQELVPVELRLGEKAVNIMALRDTGNQLTDPVTGQPVLVVGADIAGKLAGLTKEQLKKPVESIGAIPGLRLIPYRTVGQEGAMLLGMRLKNVRIGNRKGSHTVAFAPGQLCPRGTYQALTGGFV